MRQLFGGLIVEPKLSHSPSRSDSANRVGPPCRSNLLVKTRAPWRTAEPGSEIELFIILRDSKLGHRKIFSAWGSKHPISSSTEV